MLAAPGEVRERIGLSGQYAAVDEHLTGYENLDMIGRLYQLGRASSRSRARELLEQFDLVESADRPVKTYSGGMRRRLDLAGALVTEPKVLFLDEPTAALDPRSRTALWEVLRELVSSGTTLLLTTQYLEEADQLADQIVVIDHGNSIAEGASEELKQRVGGERIELTVTAQTHVAAAESVLAAIAVGEVQIAQRTPTLTAPVRGGTAELSRALDELKTRGVEVAEVGLRRPTLDDVFLALTGHLAEPPADKAVEAVGEAATS